MHGPTALETAFPAAAVNRAAEQESWRKEVHRPATHTHKWWAQRLGTVFRGAIVSALTATEEEAVSAFGSAFRAPGTVVFDPFAGSGTTLVEALKLGCRVVGQDINPVATLVQRQAVAAWDEAALAAAFKDVESRVKADIDALHVTATGETVLYYFWVAQAPDDSSADATPVDLFSSRVFAKHAYAKKYPRAQANCPNCDGVVVVDAVADSTLTCGSCGQTSSLQGPVAGAWMTRADGSRVKITAALKGQHPTYRMYAKLVLGGDGQKRYEPIDDFDRGLYARCSHLLQEKADTLVLPVGQLEDGYNTRQALNWGFRTWNDFFNDRQLYCLGRLGAAVKALPEGPEREALAALFSGTLEFNNLFCSFKGEGTGAVRHMFSHHILKPERVPLEAHPWGTPASSGSFSTLYKSRLLRALDYKNAPHDIVGDQRVNGLSEPLAVPIYTDSVGLLGHTGPAALIATGSSAQVGLPDESVDLVVTDPPFFDNVHYSELADFFHAWLVGVHPYATYPQTPTTRSAGEVQHTQAAEFGRAIGAVWREAARVLKPHGLLAFTFHQAKPEGWVELMRAVRQAGLVVTAIVPVKAEMSVAAPKSGASDPSNLDSFVVCRREAAAPAPSVDRAILQLRQCQEQGIAVGYADVQSVVRGVVLARHTQQDGPTLDSLTFEAQQAADAACVELGVTSARLKGRP